MMGRRCESHYCDTAKPTFELAVGQRGERSGQGLQRHMTWRVLGVPPDETVAVVQGQYWVVCSHLPRSVESAKRLGFEENPCNGRVVQ